MATALRDLRPAAAARAEVDAYFSAAQRKSLLRFITCGSVDDGKSTLIGRLLFDSKMLFEDQLAALADESGRIGTQGEGLDFALLVDGLGAEREQGITIDVAYRFFETERRKFIVADTPGHEQYTRNMVTGASTADLAVILVDARKGILKQTRRHSHVVHLLGIRHLVLAINKMDLVGYSQERFDEIVADYRRFADTIGIEAFAAMPLSGLNGDNVTASSEAMPWHRGPTLLEHLETVPLARRSSAAPFRMAVQWVNRPNSSFRGYAGRIASGVVRADDTVTVLPGGQSARVERIVTFDGNLDAASVGQSVTLTLSKEVDCSRGSLIVAADAVPELGDELHATIVWTGEELLVPGRSYWLKAGTQIVSATAGQVHHVIDVNSGTEGEGRSLALNDLGRVSLRLDRAVPIIGYDQNRELGGFILIDKISNATVAAGMVDASAASAAKAQPLSETSRILWVRGRSRAERSAFAARAVEKLRALGHPVFELQESTVRAGLSSDLADSPAAAAEHIRRVREVAKLMAAAGVHVIVTIEVPEAEAHPGRCVDPSSSEEAGSPDWVI
jgi:bifunctional enzyme CysN/CysC